eukprot:gene4313-12664_t
MPFACHAARCKISVQEARKTAHLTVVVPLHAVLTLLPRGAAFEMPFKTNCCAEHILAGGIPLTVPSAAEKLLA